MTRVAIVHDYLTQRGGAERVVLTMLKAFPGAPVYTSLYEPGSTYPEFADHDLRPMWINHIGAFRKDHRLALPLYPLVFGRLRFDPEPDVVICSSSGFAHGIQTSARKVVYCYTPPRWLYDKAPAYLSAWPLGMRALFSTASPYLRVWDRRAARSADEYLTSSPAVAADIFNVYGVRATVLPPPVQVDAQGEQQPFVGQCRGFLLCVARLAAYKNVDAVVNALRSLPESKLVVVGKGPEHARLLAKAPPNVRFVGEVSEPELRWLYANCAGLVSAAYEDYGLTPNEAAAFGKPVAVLRAGGFLDTVIEGTSGVFFDAPSPALIAEALNRLVSRTWDGEAVMAHAARFSEDGFMAQLRGVVLGPATRGDAGSPRTHPGTHSSPPRGTSTPATVAPGAIDGDVLGAR